MAKSNPAKKNTTKGKKASSEETQVISDPTVANDSQNVVDNPAPEPVVSDQQGATPNFGGEKAVTTRSMTMADLKLKLSTGERKSKRLVFYDIEGRTGKVQFLSTLFGGDQKSQGNPPAELTLTGEFAEPKAPKAKETPEERKARLKALPKLTLAEKVARAEERAAALKAKLAKQAEKPADAPAGDAPAAQ